MKKAWAKMTISKRLFYATQRLSLAYSTKYESCGIPIALFSLKKTHPAVWKLANAVGLIQRYDPFQLSLIKQDVRLIWVFEARPNCGLWNERMRICILDRTYLQSETTSPVEIASIIVHEATHARLLRRGIGYNQAIRKRVEDICHLAAVRFAKKLPDGRVILEQAKNYLSLPSSFYTNDARQDRELASLREIKSMPKWLVRLLEKRVEKRRMLGKNQQAEDW